MFYDVICRTPCNTGNENCVEKGCGSIPSVRVLGAQVIVTELSPYVNYTFTVYSKNRVSELAKDKYGVEESFSTITVTTLGTSKL